MLAQVILDHRRDLPLGQTRPELGADVSEARVEGRLRGAQLVQLGLVLDDPKLVDQVVGCDQLSIAAQHLCYLPVYPERQMDRLEANPPQPLLPRDLGQVLGETNLRA